MNYWIVKFAPFRVSWEDILATGRFEIYSVRNPLACHHLQSMKVGDRVLYYHSQIDKQIMGVMAVQKEAHQDFTTKNPQWKSVTFEPIESFKNPISLKVIKSNLLLSHIALVRQPRLAVFPITETEYNEIIKMQ